MTKLKVLGQTVRVWRTEKTLTSNDNYDLMDLADLLSRRYPQMTQGEIAEAFEKIDRVAAVEVLNEFGNGILIYPDWK